ncbi:MAG: beta-propeller fold lactonase family protein, partial [Silvibacterium sp.]|nr:beta-propeller fold lactonase family protein [Silvibacterium sp.]
MLSATRWFAMLSVAAVTWISGAQSIDLPTSKQILEPVPGSPARLNSLPMGLAWSPDQRYLALVNAGYGTVESDYSQSIAILDTTGGAANNEAAKPSDFPDTRTGVGAAQTMYSGIAFSLDGTHLYVSLDSLSAPEGGDATHTGNAIAVYSFANGELKPERLIPIPLQHLAAGRTQNQIGKALPDGVAIPAPTGLAVVKSADGKEQILVADEFSDDVLLVDAASGKVVTRFDLADHPIVPSAYPIAVVATKDGSRAFVALWNGSTVAELDLRANRVAGKVPLFPPTDAIRPSSHPVSLVLSPDGKMLYVALANRDLVAGVRIGVNGMQLARLYDSRLPGQTKFGAMPDGVAVSPDGAMLYVANSGTDSVAVFHTKPSDLIGAPEKPIGFIPTEWYPTAVTVKANRLYVATGKGQGTGPNVPPQPKAEHPPETFRQRAQRPHTYIATLLYGSLASIDRAEAERNLRELTDQAIKSNLMKTGLLQAVDNHVKFSTGINPIHHVIYIIRENRTYDQILGDLGVGDGDPSLTMYGKDITPNAHKLALQFGVLDNFYDSGEVSGDGHVWSTAAITSDYTERDWQQSYRGRERTYDFEGVVANGYPIQEKIPDINEPE